MKKGNQRHFDGTAREAAFLIGGIGTGNFSIGSRGNLRDWEIFNEPGKGQKIPFTLFAIRAEKQGEKPVTKILESKLTPPYEQHQGFFASELAGLPRFAESSFTGEYPFCYLNLSDPQMPVTVDLEAFNPLIPLDPDNSGIPCGILKYTVTNTSKSPVDISLIASLPNVVGRGAHHWSVWEVLDNENFTGSVNTVKKEKDFTGLHFTNDTISPTVKEYGDMSLTVSGGDNIFTLPYWPGNAWWDEIQLTWDEFCAKGDFAALEKNERLQNKRYKIGSVGVKNTLAPMEAKTYTFVISWNFPNRINSWYEAEAKRIFCSSPEDEAQGKHLTKNYYATIHENSWETQKYIHDNMDMLYGNTMKFHDALFSSSLPDYVLDALSSNITVARSTTCFRLASGRFFGWEGSHPNVGSCDGNCTHVWNYEQALAFLFPSLERDMRVTEFNLETEEDGKMQFRSKRHFGYANDYHPAADGQMGCLIRLYREWKISGDDEFLKSVWENAKKALNYAFTYWDSDKDFVLDSQQHNTYDIEFYGPNSLVNSMFFGALKGAAEMAEYLGEKDTAAYYREVLAKGSEKMDRILWNGEYYEQQIEDVNAYKYQYGKGCLSDQLLGQELSHMAGIGYVLPKEHVKEAVHSIFRYNFKESLGEVESVQRIYALNDDKGLLLCTWPKGGRPKLPFTYSDEVWTGIEYQVASHLIYEGCVEEGLKIVKGVRDRYNGVKRNPWNEVECGNHYARSMASWGLLVALSGCRVDLAGNKIEFNPRVQSDQFDCFFSCGKGWGVAHLKNENGAWKGWIEPLFGDLSAVKFFAGDVPMECK